MRLNYDVPFFANTPDGTHSTQAALRMVRKYFEPELDFTWAQLDLATGKTPDFAANWRMAGFLWLSHEGYEVLMIDLLDYNAFAQYGVAYLNEHYGPETTAWEVKYSDLVTERRRARRFVKQAAVDHRLPLPSDIEYCLDLGFLVQITVNLRTLHDRPGFRGRAMLVKGYTGTHFILHDPGLPPQPNYRVPRELLESAWTQPATRNLAAFRKP